VGLWVCGFVSELVKNCNDCGADVHLLIFNYLENRKSLWESGTTRNLKDLSTARVATR
jgi:hypothetical protein